MFLGDNEESKRMIETWNNEEVFFRNILSFNHYSLFYDKDLISTEELIFGKRCHTSNF